MDCITLLELNRQLSEVINSTFDEYVWVIAEISEIRTASNGHCYLELIEKAPHNNTIVARIRATIWNNRWWLCKESFESATGQLLKAGLKILVCAQVQMHEAYGLSLNIVDIDSKFTLGEAALRRQQIIKRLTDEGMIDMNKGLTIPILPQRIAIISAENAAGYGDFCHQIENNEYGVAFYMHLFKASMQGANTEKSIIEALNKIYEYQDIFDIVVIIRGGGGVADLSSFDNYDLAVNIANFPLPVIVGIGHERDNTVLDLVAHTSIKTPTAAAAFLIDLLGNQISHIEELKYYLTEATNWRIENNKNKIARLASSINSTHIKLRDQINSLEIIKEKTKLYTKIVLDNNKQKIEHYESTIHLCEPQNILQRGFSITRVNGLSIKDASKIEAGTLIETITANGTIISKTQ